MRRLEGQRGSALVEAAILFPCLVLILYWSIALTDVLVLKMKAAEAARFALWETTAWKSPPQIDGEVQRRFQDLRSPAGIERPTTGLLLYPRSSGILWRAQVDTAADEVKLAGNRIHASGGPAILGPFIGTAASWMASAVQTAMRSERFNTFGSASVRVRLLHARNDSSKVLAGGDLPGRKGGDDLGAPRSLRSLSLESPLGAERPMQLVFDTWKAWPRPAAYQLAGAPSDVGVPPQQTYPEVEKQVASQVDRIAFFGMKQQPWFAALDSAAARILGGAVTTTLLGGRPPSIFSTARMDSPDRGPITIRPAGPPQAAFVPNL